MYIAIPDQARHHTCDQRGCDQLATRIVHTDRKNTGWLVTYWCETHMPKAKP
jgi:hypothetical protein